MSAEKNNKNKQKEQDILAMANKFIAMANRMASEEEQELWRVSTAFRYAAARFSCHEAATQSENLAEDKEKLVEWFTNQFKEMLEDNMGQY